MIEQEKLEDKKEKKEVKKDKRWIDEIYMLHENEMWLNEQTKKGLILKSFDDRYATFNKGSSENISYKIVVLDEENAEEQIKSIENQGFDFVAKFKEYYIFYIDEKMGNKQLQLSNEMIVFIDRWFNKQIRKKFIGVLIFIAIIGLNIIFFYSKEWLVSWLVDLDIIEYVIAGLGFILFFTIVTRQCVLLIKSKKSFIKQKEYAVGRNLIVPKIKKFIINIWIFGIIIILPIHGGYCDNNNFIEKTSISEVHKNMPIVLIQDIEQQENLSDELIDTQKNMDDDNYADLYSSLMAPNQYKARLEYEDNANCDNLIRMQYYEILSKNLAKCLAKEIIIDEVPIKYEIDITKKRIKGLDTVYAYQGANIIGADVIYVSVSKGKRVMFIGYQGKQPVEKILNEMAEVL